MQATKLYFTNQITNTLSIAAVIFHYCDHNQSDICSLMYIYTFYISLIIIEYTTMFFIFLKKNTRYSAETVCILNFKALIVCYKNTLII